MQITLMLPLDGARFSNELFRNLLLAQLAARGL